MKSTGDEFRIDEKEYAALVTFLRRYLHQDAALEHGSVTAAAKAFRRDADERETTIVRAELERLLSFAEGLPFSRIQRMFEQDLRSCWHFRNREELEQLREALK